MLYRAPSMSDVSSTDRNRSSSVTHPHALRSEIAQAVIANAERLFAQHNAERVSARSPLVRIVYAAMLPLVVAIEALAGKS
jgi:hypothetical protein